MRGEVRVSVFGDGPGNLLRAPELVLLDPATGAADPAGRVVEVLEAAPGGRRGEEVRLVLGGVGTREAAAALAGLLVGADASHLEPLADGEYYWFQLVGCEVRSHDGRALGIVRALWETGAHDVLVVEDEQGRQVLLPAAADLLREVDVERRRIVVEVPQGLVDG